MVMVQQNGVWKLPLLDTLLVAEGGHQLLPRAQLGISLNKGGTGWLKSSNKLQLEKVHSSHGIYSRGDPTQISTDSRALFL